MLAWMHPIIQREYPDGKNRIQRVFPPDPVRRAADRAYYVRFSTNLFSLSLRDNPL
jgi:hypothetical protein